MFSSARRCSGGRDGSPSPRLLKQTFGKARTPVPAQNLSEPGNLSQCSQDQDRLEHDAAPLGTEPG